MRYISPEQLRETELHVSEVAAGPEFWTTKTAFSRYRNLPRPTSALFFVCGDLCATFYPRGGTPVTVRQGDLCFIPKGTCYHVQAERGNALRVSSYTVNFLLFDSNMEDVLLSEEIAVLSGGHGAALEQCCRNLVELSGRIGVYPDAADRFAAKSELYRLLAAATDGAREQTGGYYPIRLGVAALQREWNKNEKIEVYARLCGISTAYFYQCFRAWCGKTPVEYRNALRLGFAETMLCHTDQRIVEISRAAGFEDSFYFCRLFHRQYGLAPSAYRKAHRIAKA